MNLSPHITREEFEISQEATRKGIVNRMSEGQIQIASFLCLRDLEWVRAHYNEPLRVSSGFRCLQLNQAIGGAHNSQHMIGEGTADKDAAACDFNIYGQSVESVYQDIKHNRITGADGKPIVFDQVIQEFNQWVHLSRRMDGHNRQMALRAVRDHGKAVYIPD